MSELARFDPAEVLRRLDGAGVRFVIVGGLAAQSHGSPSSTDDLDICYARDPDNLRAIATVLEEIAAIRRVSLPTRRPFRPLMRGRFEPAA